jgi:hypothetical protein
LCVHVQSVPESDNSIGSSVPLIDIESLKTKVHLIIDT